MTRFSRPLWLVLLTLLLATSLTAPTRVSAGRGQDAVLRKRVIAGPSRQTVEVTTRRQLAYGLIVWTGTEYRGTFCPQEIDTIHLIAGQDNVLLANTAEVYFWPITKEYMADWVGTEVRRGWTLEILRGNAVFRRLALAKYTLRYPAGYEGGARELKTGKAAEETIRSYQAKAKTYEDSVSAYYTAYDAFLKGSQTVAPEQPAAPTEYVMDLGEGFIAKLPPGSYQVRLKDARGQVVAGSERKLVAFPVLAKGVGYQVIPEQKWTYPANSDDLSQGVFALPGQVLYFAPFSELQFGRQHYVKLTQLPTPSSGRGMERQKTWVHVSPLAGKKLAVELTRDGQVVSHVEEKAYYVQQRPGRSLGYDIVEWTPDLQREPPTFTAFKIKLPSGAGRYELRLVDPQGRVSPGSARSLRTIRRARLTGLLSVGLVPLVVGLALVTWRALRPHRVSAAAGR